MINTHTHMHPEKGGGSAAGEQEGEQNYLRQGAQVSIYIQNFVLAFAIVWSLSCGFQNFSNYLRQGAQVSIYIQTLPLKCACTYT